VATFGFDERHVLPALRLLPYDELVLLAGRSSLRTKGFARLRALEPDLRAVVVDPFDLVRCLEATCDAIVEAARRGGSARVSVSGGTKILCAAAMLAAFQEGVEAWYCDPDPIRLPVLRGVRLEDAVSDSARLVAGLLRGERSAEELVHAAATHGLGRVAAYQALKDLVRHGLADQRLDGGEVLVRPTAGLEVHRAHFRIAARKG